MDNHMNYVLSLIFYSFDLHNRSVYSAYAFVKTVKIDAKNYSKLLYHRIEFTMIDLKKAQNLRCTLRDKFLHRSF